MDSFPPAFRDEFVDCEGERDRLGDGDRFVTVSMNDESVCASHQFPDPHRGVGRVDDPVVRAPGPRQDVQLGDQVPAPRRRGEDFDGQKRSRRDELLLDGVLVDQDQVGWRTLRSSSRAVKPSTPMGTIGTSRTVSPLTIA